MTFDEITQHILACQLCPLASTRTHAVPGEGSQYAEVLFIGEGPGEKEDLQGRPFCGASGKFLDEMLLSINLKREDVYITNVVKCRPPGNRDPLPEEIDTCTKHYLFKQIELINPKVVCFLGRYSMGLFMKGMKISQVHGKAFQKDGRFYIALYHPAVALYNGGMRQELLRDFTVVDKILKGKFIEKVKTQVEVKKEELPSIRKSRTKQITLDI